MKLVIFALCILSSVASYSNERQSIIEGINGITNNWSESQFKAWINSGNQNTLRVGDEVVFSFVSNKNAYLTILHVDAYGVINVSFPLMDGQTEQMLLAGKKLLFPSLEDRFTLQVDPPIGRDSIYILATEKPVDKLALGLSFDETTIPVEESGLFLRDLNRILRGNRVAVSRIEQKIIGRTDSVGYNQNDIAAIFEKKINSRSISRRPSNRKNNVSSYNSTYIPPAEQVKAEPKLNLYINFEFGSARLTQMAKSNLDEVGLALQRRSLSRKKYILSGHTDDVGDDYSNQILSEQRAISAKRYLVSRYRIPSSRLATKGYGEKKPIEPGQDEFSRAANRRVEIEIWQPGLAKVENKAIASEEPILQRKEVQEREPTTEWIDE